MLITGAVTTFDAPQLGHIAACGAMGFWQVSHGTSDVFCDDPFSRFSILRVDLSSRDWQSFRPRPGRRASQDDRLESVFHQFLLVTCGPLRDTERWWVYPDAGLFSRDTKLDRVEFRFNRTYKKAFGLKSSRIIRLARSRDSGA